MRRRIANRTLNSRKITPGTPTHNDSVVDINSLIRNVHEIALAEIYTGDDMLNVEQSDDNSNTNLCRMLVAQKLAMTNKGQQQVCRLEFNVKTINKSGPSDPAYGIAFEFRPITDSMMYGVYLIIYTKSGDITNQISLYLENISYSELGGLDSTTFIFGDKTYDGTKRPLVTIEFGNFNQITLNELPFALHNVFGENTQRNVYVITQFRIINNAGTSKK